MPYSVILEFVLCDRLKVHTEITAEEYMWQR